MLVIRLARAGRKNKATFRLVLQEKTQAPKSASIETLGSFNPHMPKREEQMQLKKDRIEYWLKQGAQPSTTVHNMLVELGIISAPKRRSVFTKKEEPKGEEKPAEAAAAATPEAPATEAAPAEQK